MILYKVMVYFLSGNPRYNFCVNTPVLPEHHLGPGQSLVANLYRMEP